MKILLLYIIIYLKIIISTAIITDDDDRNPTDRQLESFINPGCPKNICDNETIITLIHILAKGQYDTIHYIWDFTGKPSILIALTPLNTTLSINWDDFMDNESDSISFSSKPIYTATLVINKIYEFNDVEDTGMFSGINSSEINAYDTQNFTWIRTNFRDTVHEVEVTVSGDNAYYFGSGKIILKLKCFGIKDHDIEFPHLLHSENSTQVDLVFDNIKIDTTKFNSTRFAAEIVLITDEQKIGDQSYSIHNKKSLDDEFTPGIFELIEVSSPESFIGSRGSYIQYRPVSYTNPERDVTTSTDTHIIMMPSKLEDPMLELNGSLAWVYYGYLLNNELIIIQGFNISFGMSEDGFYQKTNYNSWTFIMGYGGTPSQTLSKFVIIVASIGFGIPLLIIVAGCGYVLIKRSRMQLYTRSP